MGILTNPDSNHGRGLLTKISKHGTSISWLLFFLGIGFVFVMPHPDFSHHVYFSENALLPGLVRDDYVDDGTVNRFLEEFRNETMGYYDAFPHRWLRNKFRQLGLEVYTHTFKLTFPLGPLDKRSNTTGKNVYAILRAPRASSTEALVLTVPYRMPYSLDANTDISIALMYGAASFFRNQNHWAKDIIFLITQHEQLGMQSWLEAYHQIPGSIIDYGELEARAGSIQAAINLEVSTDRISHVNVKVEGLNGQLPNLDLVNLVNRLCLREGLPQMFQGVEDHRNPYSWKGYWRSWRTMMNMALRQATGTPSGNHGLFHKFGIEAITIEGVLKKKSSARGGSQPVPQVMGKIIEGTFRSLNNLLEKFHQSFFFYLLPSSSRYVSIGMYMPGFGLLGSGLVFSALCMWFRLQQELTETKEKKLKDSEDSKQKADKATNESAPEKSSPSLPYVMPPSIIPVLPQFVFAHLIGLGYLYLPLPSTIVLDQLHLHYEDSVILSLFAFTLAFLAVSVVRPLSSKYSQVLTCLAYLELSALAYGMSLCNFGLAYFVTAIYIPVAFLSYPWKNTRKSIAWLRSLLLISAHPLILLYIICFVDTALTFSTRSFFAWIPLSYNATKHALMYSVTDWFIYGNFNFPIGCLFLLPCWLLLWIVHTSRS